MPQQQGTAGAISFVPATTAQYDPAASSPANRVAALNTGHVAAAAFLGYANYDVNVAKGMYYMRQNEDAMYFQDNFRATNRLTLNMGLRWQFSPYPYDKNNVMSGFDPKSNSIVLGTDLDTLYRLGATTPGLINVLQSYGAKFITAEQAGLPKKLVKNNWHDIGPHVGFAYRALDGRKGFVLRGGFSTSYNVIPIYGWNDRMRVNAPFTASYQNYQLTASDQSPDGIGNYGLISVPTTIAGKNSADAVNLNRPLGITPGSQSFQAAYFNPSQPSSRVHDWNLTVEKEIMRDTVLRVSYIGNHAAHQDSYDNWNASIPDYVWYMTRRVSLPPVRRRRLQGDPIPRCPMETCRNTGRTVGATRMELWRNSNGASRKASGSRCSTPW